MHDGKSLHPNELALSVLELREKGDAGLRGVSGDWAARPMARAMAKRFMVDWESAGLGLVEGLTGLF